MDDKILSTSTIDHDSTNATEISPDRSFKFSFLAKILQESHPRPIPQNFIMRPIKVSRLNIKQQQETSAKNIMKRVIIQENANGYGIIKTGQNFLMKGKTINGQSKLIENQMESFLLSINERINVELEKSQKINQLPSLLKNDIETTAGPAKRISYQEVFKNLRQVRKNIKAETISNNSKVRHNLNSLQKIDGLTRQSSRKLLSKSPQNQDIKQDQLSVIKLSLPPFVQKKQFMKGYLWYDEQSNKFLDAHRHNLQMPYEKLTQKTKEISAKAYMVVDFRTLTPLSGRNVNQNIQIASITKIMTCYLSIMICKKYQVDIYSYQMRVGDKAAQTPGTTAQLQTGDILTLYQMLLALMLPSGNDASVAIAQAMGKIIQRNKKKETKKSYYETFIAHMNIMSKQLDLKQVWSNSSGLSINPNFSTVQSIIILTAIAIRNPLFDKIVKTKYYEINIKNERYGLNRKIIWRNTNRLLDNGWQGVKTGTTQNAGHCLMAKKNNLLVCVFNCDSLARRFTECERLYQRHQVKEQI